MVARASSASASCRSRASPTSTCRSSRSPSRSPGAAPSELRERRSPSASRTRSPASPASSTSPRRSPKGSSTTTIEFRLEIDTRTARVNDVKDAIAQDPHRPAAHHRRADRPAHRRRRPADRDLRGVARPAMTPEELSWFVDDVVARELQGVQGRRRASTASAASTARSASRSIPTGCWRSASPRPTSTGSCAPTNVDLAGGRGEIGGQRAGDPHARRRAHGSTTSPRRTIALPGGRKVRLDELGDGDRRLRPSRAPSPASTASRSSPSRVSRAKGASDVDGRRARSRRRSASCSAAHPERQARPRSTPRSTYTVGNYESAMETLIEGALLAVLVVFLFLRDWRATLIAAVALPLSVHPDLLGHGRARLLAQPGQPARAHAGRSASWSTTPSSRSRTSCATCKMGKSPYRAALEAADEIGLAVIAITFTIIAVFAPVSFMGGIAGQYFKQFGLTVAVAVLFSLLVARLITPMMAAYFMRGHGACRAEGRRRSCAATPRLVRLVGAAPLADLAARHRVLRRLDLRRRSCCRPASCRRRTPAASLLRRSNCRRASRLDDTERGDRPSSRRGCASMPEVR